MTSNRIWPWAVGAGIAVALILVVQAARIARQAGSPEVRYATGTAERGRIDVLVTGTGTVALAGRVGVPAEVDGVVESVEVRAGARVKKGDVIARLANPDVVAAAEQARLQLEQARQRLAATGGARAASGRVDAAAPVAGRVWGLRVKEGDSVQQGAVVANIADSEAVEVLVRVLEPERARIRPGQAATVLMDDFDGELLGSVAAVGSAPISDKTGQFYEVRVFLKNPGLLQAGMTGQVTIHADGGDVIRTGTVAWAARRVITAPISGRIENIYVAEGQQVASGAPITRIVNESWPAEVEQLRLAVAQAELAARAKEDQAAKLTVRAPRDGVVVAVNVRPGDSVAAARGAAGGELAAIASGDAATVTVAVDEMDIAKVREGQAAEVTLPALPGRKFRGRVTEVSLEGKSQNGVTTYEVTVAVEQPEGIRSGMTATAAILVASKSDALLVPVEAVAETSRGSVVRVLQGGVARAVPVRTGLRNDRVVEILDGLRPGDVVVLAEYDLASAAAQGFGPGRGFGGPGPMGFPARGLMGGRSGGFEGRPGSGPGGQQR